MKNTAAVELGRKGGMAKTKAKTKAARENAKKPRGKWVTAVRYEFRGKDGGIHSGMFLVRKNLDIDLTRNAEEIFTLITDRSTYVVDELLEFETVAERL